MNVRQCTYLNFNYTDEKMLDLQCSGIVNCRYHAASNFLPNNIAIWSLVVLVSYFEKGFICEELDSSVSQK